MFWFFEWLILTLNIFLLCSGLDVPMMLQKIGLSKGLSDSAFTSGASTFVIAYACHKVFVPVRMFLTITCTPLIVQRLRLMGILKMPVKPTPPNP